MSDTKYQITKTVRFKLEPQFDSDAAKQKFILSADNLDRDTSGLTKEETQSIQQTLEEKEDLTLVIVKLKSIKDKVSELIFCSQSYGEAHHTIFNNFKISRGWLARYLKISFYDYLNQTGSKRGSYSLSKLPFLVSAFKSTISESINSTEPTELQIGWFYRINALIGELDKVKIVKSGGDDDNRHNKTAYPNIALILNDINKRNNLEFIKEFINQLQIVTIAKDEQTKAKKTNYENLIAQIKADIADLEKELAAKLKHFLPYQSEGVLVCIGSFNYYTVNKSKKELVQKKDELMKSLDAPYNDFKANFIPTYNLSINDAVKVLSKQFNKDEATIKKDYCISEFPLSLKNTYLYLNYWRGQQRKEIQEVVDSYIRDLRKLKKLLMTKKISEDEFEQIVHKKKNNTVKAIRENKLYVFKNGFEIYAYIDLCEELVDKRGILQNGKFNDPTAKDNLEKDIAELQLKKDSYWVLDTLDSSKNKFKLEKFNVFQNEFIKVSQKYGIYTTQEKSIEKDEVFSQKVGYWCVIIEDHDKHKFLCMIPRDGNNSIGNAYNYITNPLSDMKEGNDTLYYFESLTFRALQKLCYKSYDNTFKAQFKNIIPDNEFDNDKINAANTDKEKEQVRIGIYQQVLKKINDEKNGSVFLDYDGIEGIISNVYQSIEDFDADLNKICYAKQVKTSIDIVKRLKDDYNAIVFEITSQDLKFNLKKENREQGISISNPRYATSIWDLFWSDENKTNNYPIRLNPEIKVFYREPKASRLHKYEDNAERKNQRIEKKFKNRYLQDQFTLAMTVTENAVNPYVNYAFVKDSKDENIDEKNKNYVKNIDNNIKKFSKKLIDKSNIKFALGIDVGTDSLAFVAACDTDMKPIKFNVLEIKQLDYYKTNAELNNILKQNGLKLRTKKYFYVDHPNYFDDSTLYDEIFADGQYDKTQEEIKNAISLNKLDLLNKEGNMIYFLRENPSYFLNVKQYHKTFCGLKIVSEEVAAERMQNNQKVLFEEKEVAAIDLTNAKVINGHIVTNGDILTHLKLKLLKAERQLSKLFQKDFKPENIEIFVETNDGKQYVKSKNILPTEYAIITRNDNDEITDFSQLYDYILKDTIPETNHIKVMNGKVCHYFYDENHSIVIKQTISEDEYNYCTGKKTKKKINKKELYACVKRGDIVEKDGNYYYISRTILQSDPIYEKVIIELYEKNYTISKDTKKAKCIKNRIADLKTKNQNFEIYLKDKDSICVKYNEVSTLYIDDKKYNQTASISDIIEILADFKDNQRLEMARVVEKINNYRKALVANMVGVVMQIYRQCLEIYKDDNIKGLIAFEGLKDSKNHSDFAKFEGYITIPFRTAMLKKLQDYGIVPPFAEINKLSDEEKYATKSDGNESVVFDKGTDVRKFGLLWFVSEASTSKCCPLCGKKTDFEHKKYPYANKEGIEHADNFQCFPKGDDPELEKCGFCTEMNKFTSVDKSEIDPKLQSLSVSELIELFSSLDSNDKCASYNIAKRAIWNI